MIDQPAGDAGYWIRLGDGSLQHYPRLLSEEEFARQHPGAYAAALAARRLDRTELERD